MAPLPKHFETLGKTWRYYYPDWKYELLDNDRLNKFVVDNYPEYWLKYNKFKYNIQRWDIIRNLILNKIGGIYVDFSIALHFNLLMFVMWRSAI